jgi:ATP/maltotriose-dependent transcriptional regulator MalT
MNHPDQPFRIPLTRTELKCLGYVAEGWNDEQIGKTLTLSRLEVEAILAITVSKLGVENRAAAVARATRLGLLDGAVRLDHVRSAGGNQTSSS